MSLLSFVKKIGIDIFFYFTVGARIDAAVEWKGSMRMFRGDIIKPDAIPKYEDGSAFYEQSDITKRWELETMGILVIKNNSKNYAYNLLLTNALSIFSTIAPISKLTSIAPNEKIEIPVTFRQFVIEDNGVLADTHSGIPNYIKNRFLVIQYENEAGVKMLTKSFIDFEKIHNSYTTI